MRRESFSSTVLALTCALTTACFDPQAPNGAEDGGDGATSGASASEAQSGPAGEVSTTQPDDQDEDEDDAAETDPADTDPTEDPTASGESTDGEETDGTETGEACVEELGTDAHCLDCDDACDDGDQCSPDGCATPSAIGFSEPFTGIGGYPGRLWGFPVELGNGWVSELDFHAVGNGGDIQLALYSDDGGVPADLVVASDILDNYAAGPHALEVDPAWVDAGTYWLMARNTSPSQIGLDFDPTTPGSFPLTAIFIDFNDELPTTLENTSTFNSYPINLWLTQL